jgi:hypothetical protein
MIAFVFHSLACAILIAAKDVKATKYGAQRKGVCTCMQIHKTPFFMEEIKSLLDLEALAGTILNVAGPAVVIADLLINLILSDDKELARAAREDEVVLSAVNVLTSAASAANGLVPRSITQLGQA